MDDLILNFNSVTICDNYAKLLLMKDEIENELSSTKSNEELIPFYEKIYTYNNIIKEHVSFNPELYSDNIVLMNTVNKCNECYNLSLTGPVRKRLIHSLTLYNYMLLVIQSL